MGDYHRARWRATNQIWSSGTVIAADNGRSDKLYGWATTADSDNYVCLSEKPADQADIWNRALRFWQLIRRKDIQMVCIPGYGRPEYLLYLIASRLLRQRILLFAESWYPGPLFLDRLKGWFLRWACDGIFASGERAAQHFEQRLGFSPDKIRTGYSVVDNRHFNSLRGVQPSRQRTLLCVARFSSEKNLIQLIKDFRQSELPRKGWRLRLVGGGPQETTLRTLVTEGVELQPWKPYEELPQIYAAANAFILPSSFEPWGLVVNEAMAAGLPVLISSACGCVPDLVDTKLPANFVFDPNSEVELLASLNTLGRCSTDQLQQSGVANQQRIANFSPDSWAATVLKLALLSNK